MTIQVAFNSDYNSESILTADMKSSLEKIASAGFTHVHRYHE